MAVQRVWAKIKGEVCAEFDIEGNVAIPVIFPENELETALRTAENIFPSGADTDTVPRYSATVSGSGGKWDVKIRVECADGTRQELWWSAGEFSGTRGVALYRAFLAFAAGCAEGGPVRAQLETERAERREIARRALATMRPRERGESREESAPTPAVDAVTQTGKTMAEMSAAVRAFYGNGSKPSDALPDPTVRGREWAGIPERTPAVLVCEFKGPVDVLNMERTHGKCPSCTTYIPLAPEPGDRESAPQVSKNKCTGVGSAPAPGTRVLRNDHNTSAPDDFTGKTSAPCPGCARVVAVTRDGVMCRHNGVVHPEVPASDTGKLGKHNVGGVASPASKGLKSKALDIAEHGSVPGDPSAGSKRRVAETQCKGSGVVSEQNGGTAQCEECPRAVELVQKRKGDEVVWVFPGHVRGGESFRSRGGRDGYVRGERRVTPRGEGRDAGKGARDHGGVDGSATTGRANMAPVQPKRGWIATAGTMALSMTVRPGIDSKVEGKRCPVCNELPEIAHKGKGSAWRRRHSREVRAYEEKRAAVREARKAMKVAQGLELPRAVRRELRRRASIGSSAVGTLATTGVVVRMAADTGLVKGE